VNFYAIANRKFHLSTIFIKLRWWLLTRKINEVCPQGTQKKEKKKDGCYLTNIPVHFMFVGYIIH